MSKMSNLPTKTLARMVYQEPVGSPNWILYKGTLLYRRWALLYGIKNAAEMHGWWYDQWQPYVKSCQEPPDQVELF